MTVALLPAAREPADLGGGVLVLPLGAPGVITTRPVPIPPLLGRGRSGLAWVTIGLPAVK
jgi:hypothetical protein